MKRLVVFDFDGTLTTHDTLIELLRFARAAQAVATMRGLNVLAVNVMKTGTKRYKIYVTPLRYDKGKPRAEQTTQLARAYADELERMLRLYPEQWYNYFSFWK